MIAAFFLVAAYLGFADVGSRLMDPPPLPVSALSAPERLASAQQTAVDSRLHEAKTER